VVPEKHQKTRMQGVDVRSGVILGVWVCISNLAQFRRSLVCLLPNLFGPNTTNEPGRALTSCPRAAWQRQEKSSMADMISPPGGPDSSPSPSAGSTPPTQPRTSKWRRFAWRWLKRLGIGLVILVALSGTIVGVAEHKTSSPTFCGSCHIMEPYYASWQADLHGRKLDVACVECHYAPGERNTIKSQLRGLSQVASYVSGRYGTTRLRAHVDNHSCLTSKCHGDARFMDKEINLGTVKFVHANHLQAPDQRLAATQQELEETRQKLLLLLGDKRFAELDGVAQQAIAAKEQLDQMTSLVSGWNAKIETAVLAKYSQLLQQRVRIHQLQDLQCTNCHSYGVHESRARDGKGAKAAADESSAHHFTVKTTSCYTCHFNNQAFNTGTASCLLCHTLPTKEIVVHKELDPRGSAQLSTPDLSKQAVRMDHRAILERKVDCISCHADVAMENAPVTRRDCERCHGRPEFFKDWKQPVTLELVERYHAAHVPEQRAKCLDCHAEIHHQLVPARQDGGKNSTGFLSEVMSNCTNCHPHQHTEQIKLLNGAGGVGIPKSDANLMFGSRTNCLGCHTAHTLSSRGSEVVRGNVSGCVACHGDKHTMTFEKWKKGLQVVQMDATEAYDKARQSLEKAKGLSSEIQRKATELLKGANTDLQLVKRGNGIHNVSYALELLDSVTQRCQQVVSIINKESGRKP
jgi:nitrate/TMAO reductase-like tetraheme cytochrome c subunit